MTTARFTAARFSSPKILLVLGFFALSSVFLLGVGRSPVPSLPVVNAQGKCSILPDNSKLPDATVGVPYTQIFSGANGTLPYTFMLSGNLLPGLKFTNSGIGGTPTKAGSVSINVQMSDSAVSPCTTAKAYNLTVLPDPNCPDEIILSPAAGTLRPGVATVNYSATFTASGGQTPYVFTVDGNTPDGLTLAPSGELTGTPTRTGKFDFTVQAKDNKGCIGTADYSISIADAGSIDTQAPTVKVLSPANGESIPSGTSFGIAWQADDNVGVDKQDVSFSSDDGLTFPLSIAANLDGTARDFQWSVPKDLRTTRGRVRVTATDATGNSGSATSGRISITGVTDTLPPSISLVSPNANIPDQSIFPNDGKKKDQPEVDEPIKIEWSAVDDTGIAGFAITATTKPLVNGGGPADSFPIVIADSVAGDKRSFDWTDKNSPLSNLKNIDSDTVSIRITVKDTAGNTAQAVSGKPFAIHPRPVIGNKNLQLDPKTCPGLDPKTKICPDKALKSAGYSNYSCGQIFIYGNNFNPRSIVQLNGDLLSPFRGLVKLEPQPSKFPAPIGPQLITVERKAKVKDATGTTKLKAKFDDKVGAINTAVVITDGLYSLPKQILGDGPRAPRVQITSPARSTKFIPGQEINITWTTDTKCKVEAQQIIFVPGNNGFDEECGRKTLGFCGEPNSGGDTTEMNKPRDTLVANLDGNVRSFTWKVPQTFTDFGRLRVKACSIEDISSDTIGTGNPDNVVPNLKITAPTSGGPIIADGKTMTTINWTLTSACAGGESFLITFTRQNTGSKARVISDKPSFSGILPIDFQNLLGSAQSVTGTLRVEVIGSPQLSDEVTGVILTSIPPNSGGGGTGQSFANIQLDNTGFLDQFGVYNLILTDQVTIKWEPDNSPNAAPATSFDIQFVDIGPNRPVDIAKGLSGTTRSFIWKLSDFPQSQLETPFSRGVIRITASTQAGSYTGELKSFTILPTAIYIRQPQKSANEDPPVVVLNLSQRVQFQWDTRRGPIPAYQQIQFSPDGSFSELTSATVTIADKLPPDTMSFEVVNGLGGLIQQQNLTKGVIRVIARDSQQAKIIGEDRINVVFR